MKKGPLLNQALSEIIAGMGHGQLLVIGDAGLPIPHGPRRVDLALTSGVPSFLDTVRVVLSELQVEEALIAQETQHQNPTVGEKVIRLLAEHGVPLRTITHDELKRLSRESVAVVRTGECTPYANIILRSGVTF
ncbi:D-ribose pyranase [Thermaerobacter sp. FW80]|uniref:D-ribose pyranase n=1 Tax=Thermaerobacter sp. FW80 TaxID=2546351 RepID=UPI0010755754|nr:D-ribose pyranase [Thermaerobacter sp. FW80]QBS37359.1 D-ribose pyranase [Thermaerobacter sp. FW80]